MVRQEAPQVATVGAGVGVVVAVAGYSNTQRQGMAMISMRSLAESEEPGNQPVLVMPLLGLDNSRPESVGLTTHDEAEYCTCDQCPNVVKTQSPTLVLTVPFELSSKICITC